MTIRVAHLTSVHSRADTRIFHKECLSLSRHNFEVILVVADGLGAENKSGVEIRDVGKTSGRLRRLTVTAASLFKKAMSIDADLYHIHDPELMFIGLLIKLRGKKVIFDAHEDLPKQILNKPYINHRLRKPISRLVQIVESSICTYFDAIVAATPYIKDKFAKKCKHVIDVNNFPIMGELSITKRTDGSKSNICYVGGLSKARGLEQMLSALTLIKSPVKLKIAGAFNEVALEAESKSHRAWGRVDTLGYLDRKGVKAIYKDSFAGLVVLQPIPNYLDALPVKMFEYMSAGLPVIASDFDLWRNIIEKNQCGICVNPTEPGEIARAIDYLYQNPELAELMGENGKKSC